MFESVITAQITAQAFLICTGTALLLGLLNAALFMRQGHPSKSYVLTLALLPAIVELIIMMVNGNIGAGVAIAGAFSLVRFRSVRGAAHEIAGIFLAMGLGIACGMGYVAIAGIFFAIMAVYILLLTITRFGAHGAQERELKITIPENLDYEGLFDDLLQSYTTGYRLDAVKTMNMGTMYQLRYRVQLRDSDISKAFMDEIRQRNGNLNVLCGRVEADAETM